MALPGIDLGPTFGATAIGVFVAIFLTGILTLQTWNYLRAYQDDSKGLKALVILVYLTDTVHTILFVYMAYHYLVTSFGDFLALTHVVPAWPANAIVESIVALSVQSFYCMRVYRVTRSRLIALGAWVIVLVRQGFIDWTVADISRGLDTRSLAVNSGLTARWPLVASTALGAAADVVIAGCLCAGMLRIRAGTLKTNKVVDKIIAFTIGSGLITSILAVAELITYLTMDNLVYLSFYLITAKVYANSMLASLNERSFLRAELETGMDSGPESSVAFGSPGTRMTHTSGTHNEQGINIQLLPESEKSNDGSSKTLKELRHPEESDSSAPKVMSV